MSIYMEIDDVVETLRQAKGREKCSTLLIGAGCSATAGIPTATQFVEIIKTKYPRSYERAKLKDYPNCMAQLSLAERRDLIAAHIDKSKINWAHIGIAQLIKHGYVDRVLTTNFDQLVVKSCAMINIFPAVYDFASSQLFKPADVPDQAIFYLHGQRTGFKLMNTGDECSELSGHFAPVFEDAGKKRVWIVAGYSGECDPVFEHLAKVERFDNRLFWIGYRDEEPSHHVREKLLLPEKDAHFVKGFDADSFFITLAQRLECFPPNFIGSPFTHLDELLDMLIEFPVENGAGVDIVANARDNIRGAIVRFETPAPADSTKAEQEGIVAENVAQEAAALFSAGKYAELIKLAGDLTPPYRGIPLEQLYWAYTLEGNEFYAKAQREPVHRFEEYAQAIQLYSAAASLKPNGHEAFNNWGNALSNQARTKSRDQAGRLFTDACAKYAEAVRIKPDKPEAFNNWGNALFEQAKTKHGKEADRLFEDSCSKYAEAVRIKPDMHEAFNNWGNALLHQAKTKSGDEADRLFESAHKQLKQAEQTKPGQAAYNLACLFALQGNVEEALQWLARSKDAGKLPSRDHIDQDTDLDSIRMLEEFQQIIE
ncbi:hypothetical protein FY034_00805 [Trichlorobacter lovleyi]|uniref:TPR end-of-group domain-containing protein n=1 Tax=Trichlorobacter lovleyi TaxID=313985 RepID=UPI00223EFECF|nr:hypothetical protein [Trichlorobacter lovleyi]QOX77540.1 hypothetical protein FY034_00805 [Trichlorobacter lovleyi]